MSYVDGFVLAVPAQNEERYRAHAEAALAVFMKHGALRCVECWGDDVPRGKVTDFQGAVKAEDGEVVLFSWIEWPSKAVRDAGHPKVMAELEGTLGEMPFDGRRMIYGGFRTIVDTAAGAGS
jgi:uncharacterized protein YbaA (DUF1428 family)